MQSNNYHINRNTNAYFVNKISLCHVKQTIIVIARCNITLSQQLSACTCLNFPDSHDFNCMSSRYGAVSVFRQTLTMRCVVNHFT